eukprot:scaffold29579_cov60-Cyclotella_meneghiniana.AAC.3
MARGVDGFKQAKDTIEFHKRAKSDIWTENLLRLLLCVLRQRIIIRRRRYTYLVHTDNTPPPRCENTTNRAGKRSTKKCKTRDKIPAVYCMRISELGIKSSKNLKETKKSPRSQVGMRQFVKMKTGAAVRRLAIPGGGQGRRRHSLPLEGKRRKVIIREDQMLAIVNTLVELQLNKITILQQVTSLRLMMLMH